MDNRTEDEDLTIENVDEWIETLALDQPSQPLAMTPLVQVAHNLQSIYAEDRTLENAWLRVKAHAAALTLVEASRETEDPLPSWPLREQKKAEQSPGVPPQRELVQTVPLEVQRPRRPSRLRFNRGIGLVAAVALLAILAWPALSYAFHIVQPANSQLTGKAPTLQATRNGSALLPMETFVNSYFTIEHPADWVATRVTTDHTALQTTLFHPSSTSSVAVTVSVLPKTSFSSDQLLHNDADLQRGKLEGTNTTTSHGLLWTIGLVNFAGSAQAQPNILEIAYTNQRVAYRVTFNTPVNIFSSYTTVFDLMLHSFDLPAKAKITPAPGATPPSRGNPPGVTPVPTVNMPTPTPGITPTPTASIPTIQQYVGQYFTLQYPATWVITSVTTGGNYLQTVQIRPSATSSVFVNINALYPSNLSGKLLLLLDPDVMLNSLLSTSTITSRGISWAVDLVDQQTQGNHLEVAYSNQNAPYRLEFGAPSDQFDAYNSTFGAIFSSFYPNS